MKQYHKIQTVYKRDPETKFRTLLEGEYSLPEFGYLENNNWIFTEKVDGTNIRIMWNGEAVTFGGKTDNAQLPVMLANKLSQLSNELSSQFASKFGEAEVCLYGEGYGAKIQKGGGNYSQEQRFVLFDVQVGDWWLLRKDVEDIAQFFEMEAVPIIGHGTLPELVEIVRAGFNSEWGDFPAEGIVARPDVELFNRAGKRIITKLKQRDFIKF